MCWPNRCSFPSFHFPSRSCTTVRVELRAGDRIDRYTLVRPLGKGGQGSVWQVVDPLDQGSLRALKLVQLADAGQAAFVRARREAKILAHLTHPSLCACHGFFEDLDRGLVGVVLDLVQGRPLDEVVKEGQADQVQRMSVMRQVAEVLAHVHAGGLAHRDLKPANILVTDNFWNGPDSPGTVKLVDFGIAVTIGNPHKLTSVGGVIGTIPYLSPELFEPRERLSSEESCARDVFAFGVIAYELHFGGHPTGLGHSASFEVMAQRYRELLSGTRAWPPRSLPGAWGLALNACLALRPEDRPRNGSELLEILRTGRMPARSMISRTETHTPALGSVSLSAPPIGKAMTPSMAPITAPMPMVSPGPPPSPVRDRRATKSSIHGPVYALALAIVVLAVVIFFKEANTSSHDAESPPMTLPQANSMSQPRELPSAITSSAVAANDVCCGGEQCKPPQRNTRDSYCATAGKCEVCASKRKFVTGACKEELEHQRRFLLRLASVDRDSPHTEVCFRQKDAPRSNAVCVLKKDVQNPTAQRLLITTQDLLDGHILVEINEGGKNLARGTNSTLSGLKTSTLCVGLVALIGKKQTKVEFFLDDP